MNAELLLEHFHRIGDASDAVPRLRRFILDLAVRGKLVPQDPNDEPASTLLSRIASEKNRLVKAKIIAPDKSLPPIPVETLMIELPAGWEWAQLGALTQLITSGSRDWAKYYSDQGAIFVRMGNLSKDHYRLRLEHIQRVMPPADGEGTRTRLDEGDILISITGEVGMLGLIPENFGEAYINQHTAMVRPMTEIRGRYLAEVFRSPFAQCQFNEPQRGIKNSFRLTDVAYIVVPLPPLAEQHRIVAKVDELMALCDRLEAARTERETKRDRLTAASLSRLNAPDPDPDTFADHARFALDNLPAITARRDQVKQLRQTILNLAVRGKLVPQDPNDEPASVLLKRIAAEIKLYATKYRVLPAKTDPIIDASLPFHLPEQWAWVRLGCVFNVVTDGDHQPPPKSDSGIAFLTIGNVTTGVLDFSGCRQVPPEYYNSLPYYRTPAPGDILYTVVGATYGRPIIVESERPFCVQRHIAMLKPCSNTDTRYLHRVLASPLVYEQATGSTTGTAQPTIGLGPLRNFLLPLPPLAEQHRIVAKVDELMALCDSLENSIGNGDDTRSRLLSALLHDALSEPEADD